MVKAYFAGGEMRSNLVGQEAVTEVAGQLLGGKVGSPRASSGRVQGAAFH